MSRRRRSVLRQDRERARYWTRRGGLVRCWGCHAAWLPKDPVLRFCPSCRETMRLTHGVDENAILDQEPVK